MYYLFYYLPSRYNSFHSSTNKHLNSAQYSKKNLLINSRNQLCTHPSALLIFYRYNIHRTLLYSLIIIADGCWNKREYNAWEKERKLKRKINGGKEKKKKYLNAKGATRKLHIYTYLYLPRNRILIVQFDIVKRKKKFFLTGKLEAYSFGKYILSSSYHVSSTTLRVVHDHDTGY